MKTYSRSMIAFYTILRREIIRMFRIASQIFLPSVISTALYFLIFGSLIGEKIGLIEGESYGTFIAPGLIMMAVITNAYNNVSSSLFSLKFQKSIDELLISPNSQGIILSGFVSGGIVRGLIIALLIFGVSWLFITVPVVHPILTFLVIFIVASIFALAGFINALLSRTFDDLAMVLSFLLTPLTYLGGVFYSHTMLSAFWQNILYFNPVFYMIEALRFTMLGNCSVNLYYCFVIIFTFLALFFLVSLFLLKKGVGLKN